MARTSATAKKTESTALVNWDEELAKQSQIAADMEANSGGGQFFSMKNGVLSFNDAPMPDNQMGVIIVDAIFENVFYEGVYDANNPSPPVCFAFGRTEDMRPHESVFKAEQAQNETCKGCQFNEWASAQTGRGKACRNTRRLAIIAAGTFLKDGRFQPFDDLEHYTATAIAYMKLPVTSIKGYAGFVKQVAGVLSRPPHGIFTKIKVVPDAKTQFKVIFEPIDKVPNALMPAVMKRHEEAKTLIDFPYSLEMEERTPPPPARNARGRAAPVAAKKPVKRKF